MSTCSRSDQPQVSAESSPQPDESVTTSTTAESCDGSTSPASVPWNPLEETSWECGNMTSQYFPVEFDTSNDLFSLDDFSSWSLSDAAVHDIYLPKNWNNFQGIGIRNAKERTSKSQNSVAIADADDVPRSISLVDSPSTLLDTESTLSLATPWAIGDGHDSEATSYACPQCPKSFQRAFELEEHAKITRHKPFACKQCKQSFSRRDAWTRHRQLHQAEGSHPCPHCDKYRGRYAFKRKDHLKKHLMKVHRNADHPRLCTFSSCKLSSPYGSFRQFERTKDYTKHMREDHGDHL